MGFFPRQQQQKEEELDGHEWPALTAATLVELHQRQVRQVPFENLDQHSARHIVLDLDVIYDKVVQRQRGGFCFELNGLYAEMLRRLGFDVVLYPARVQSEGSWTTLKSHVVTVVRVKEPKAKKQNYPPDDDDDDGDGCELQTWISDVGYASCPHTPLRYDWIGVEQPGDGEWAGFRLTRVKAEVAEDDPDQECVMMERRRKADGEWLKAILIYEQPRSLAELTPNCDALQADEETHLSKRILISAISESGRKTMSGAYRLITTTFADGQRVERNIMKGDEDGERVARGGHSRQYDRGGRAAQADGEGGVPGGAPARVRSSADRR